jgi:Sec-independent protein translocase protein TatA
MFDTSWNELFVMTGLCVILVGRKDLPAASRFVGSQVGRVVGLLQGARVRADRFAAQNELRQLQNELRAGLRELDAVKAEIAVTASTRGTFGRTLGATVPGVNKREQNTIIGGQEGKGASTAFVASHASNAAPASVPTGAVRPLAPRSQAVAAVAEDEWEKQGIGFVSKAEQRASNMGGSPSGAKLLSNLIQQSLIFDQHDRVVQEQQDALRSRVDDVKQTRLKASDLEKKKDT